MLDQTKSKTLVTQNISSTTFKEDLNTIYKGVMAQDLLKLGFDDSVSVGHDGYYMVDYNKIDVNMEKI